MRHNIVLIDDNFSIRQIIKVFFKRLSLRYALDIKTYSSDNGVEGLGFVYITSPSVVIVDTTLPKYSGKEVLDFLIQNDKFKSKNSTVIVLHEGTKELNLPLQFVQIDKSEKHSFTKLMEAIFTSLRIVDTGVPDKFFTSLAQFIISNSTKDDILNRRIETARFIDKILPRFKWFFLELSTSMALTLALLIFGKTEDENIVQQNLDKKVFRTKYYPTLIVTLVSFLLIAINLSLFIPTQLSLLDRFKISLQADETDPPNYLQNLPNTNFSAGGFHAQLSKPRGIAVDSAGDIYIVDTNLHRIQKFNPDGSQEREWGKLGTDLTEFQFPSDLALGSSNNLFVTDTYNHRITKYTTNGTRLGEWGSNGSGNGQFSFPEGIASGNSNILYVVDRGNNRIQMFDEDGDYISQWGASGTGDGEFDEPTGIDIDSSGNVYIADSGNDRIQKFSDTGTHIATWGSTGSGDGQFNNPKGLKVNNSGDIYVADTGNNRIQVLDFAGNYSSDWGTLGFGNGQFNQPYSIDFDTGGNIYVSDNMNSRFQKFDSGAVYQTKWWGSSGTQNGQYYSPFGIALSLSGGVYVVDSGNNRVQRYNVGGSFASAWGVQGSGNGNFDQPAGIALDSSGNVYVADKLNNRIQKFSSTGNYITKWGTFGSGNGELYYPQGIFIDGSNNIYVTDTNNHRIQVFNTSGGYIDQFGSAGSGDGQFNYPVSIGKDSSGNFYVVDSGNDRIQKFDPSYNFVFDWGTTGSGDGQFHTPSSLAVDTNDYIYVMDQGNYRLQKFNTDGDHILSTGEYGIGVRKFFQPNSIVSFQDLLLISDNSNHVQVYSIPATTPTATRTPSPTVIPTASRTPTPLPSSSPIPTPTRITEPQSTVVPTPLPSSTTVPTSTGTPVPFVSSTPTQVFVMPSQTPTITPTTGEISVILPTDIALITTTPTPITTTAPESMVKELPVVKNVVKNIAERVNTVEENSPILNTVVNTAKSIEEVVTPIQENLNYLFSLKFIGSDLATNGVTAANVVVLVSPLVATTFAQPRLIYYLLSLFWRKKEKQAWGIILDNINRSPVAFARISLIKEGKVIDSQTTDLQGKYGFIVDKGAYKLLVSHPDYLDFSTDIAINYNEEILAMDYELSPKNRSDLSSSLKWCLYSIKKFIKGNLFILNTVIFSTGFVYTIFALANSFSVFNYIILGLYILQIILVAVFYFTREKKWGQVIDISTSTPVPGAIIRLFDNQRQLDVAISDNQGRYSFVLKPGEYFIKVNAAGFMFPTSNSKDVFVNKIGEKMIRIGTTETKRFGVKLYVQKIGNYISKPTALVSPFN